MTPAATIILNVGLDQGLLTTRTLVLRSAGYLVESASSTEDADRCFRAGDFDLVILCHSIPEHERHRLIWLIRNSGSATPVVFVSANATSDRFADLSIDNRPHGLLRAIAHLLSQQNGRG